MAGLAQTMPGVDFVRRDATGWFVATRLCRDPAIITCNLVFQRRRRRFISGRTGRQDKCRLAARANDRPPASVLEDNETKDKDVDTCEIVQGSDVTPGEGEGTFQAYLVKAIKNNSGVSILFLTDVVRGRADNDTETSPMADSLIRWVYFEKLHRLTTRTAEILLIVWHAADTNLFRRVPWSKERQKDENEKWRELHSPDRVARDIDIATEYLVKHFGSTGQFGVIGFCFGGGRMIETLARDSSNLFATGAILYATRFESSLATQIRAPLLLIAGGGDDLCSPAIARHLEETVQGSKGKIYPGFGHAFAHHPSSPEEDEAAEDAFTDIRQRFYDHLISDSTG